MCGEERGRGRGRGEWEGEGEIGRGRGKGILSGPASLYVSLGIASA